MSLKINPKELSEALNITLKWIPSISHIPSTRGYLLEFIDGDLYIHATDASSSSIVLCLRDVTGEPKETSIVIDAKKLNSIVSTMARTGNDIEMDIAGNSLLLSCDGHSPTMNALATRDEFPIPDLSEASVNIQSISPGLFSKCIGQVKSAADPDNPRQILSGIHFNDSDVVSADGNRVIVSSGMSFTDEPVTIPAASCFKIAGALNMQTEQTYVCVKDGKVFISWDTGIIRASVLAGDYPDYKSVLPKESKTNITVPRDELLVALGITNQFSSESSNLVIMKVFDGELVLESTSITGKNISKIPLIDIDGPDTLVGISSVYLTDAVTKMGDPLDIGMGEHKDMITVKTDLGFYVHCIMPMHIIIDGQEDTDS